MIVLVEYLEDLPCLRNCVPIFLQPYLTGCFKKSHHIVFSKYSSLSILKARLQKMLIQYFSFSRVTRSWFSTISENKLSINLLTLLVILNFCTILNDTLTHSLCHTRPHSHKQIHTFPLMPMYAHTKLLTDTNITNAENYWTIKLFIESTLMQI